MPDFPAQPLPPREFFATWLPAAFAEHGVPAELRALDLELGVRLDGEGGGEWIVALAQGAARVSEAPRDKAAFTYVQTVADWRGALWEGRGGAIGRQASRIFRPGEPLPSAGDLPAPGPATFAAMGGLDGFLRLVVAGGAGGDFAIGFKLGPGPIPAEPSTTLTLRAEDAEAMERGDFNPLEAFMAGRIEVAGDLSLLMQVQAIALRAGR